MEDYSKEIKIGSKVIIESTQQEAEVIKINKRQSGVLSLPQFNLYYLRPLDASPPIWKMRLEISSNINKPKNNRGKYIF